MFAPGGKCNVHVHICKDLKIDQLFVGRGGGIYNKCIVKTDLLKEYTMLLLSFELNKLYVDFGGLSC